MARLNATQRQLIREIDNLLDRFNLDPRKIIEDQEPASWTPRLQLARNQLIRSEIIMDYTFIDEFLNTRIAHFFFGKKRTFPSLWRTKKFKLFNFHVLEELSLMKKLQLVRAISPIPQKIREDIERLNALRNGIAHAFFPENLKKSKPAWKGKTSFHRRVSSSTKKTSSRSSATLCQEYILRSKRETASHATNADV